MSSSPHRSASDHPVSHGAPVIAIDGPTASGKGTIAVRVAEQLGFHYLDSGALYRLVALQLVRAGEDGANEAAAVRAAEALDPRFGKAGEIWLGEQEVSNDIREDGIGLQASRLAVHPAVRLALTALQHRFRQAPGLVADGRDMGTVVFPDAVLKIYLTASVEERAQRRHKQLIEKGFSATLDKILHDLMERDRRDAGRAAAPLKPAEDALWLNSAGLTIDETVDRVLEAWRARESA
ncbi:MAG: (d)CMP kinase [Lautropia sp.]|nr:(d)CMP kinase [Lautropia sp.]